MIDLSVVIVNYNNLRVLRDCLPSLPAALEGLDAEVVISDNGSSDGSLDWIRKDYPSFRIIENRANLGFAEGNNRAFPHVRGRYVLLLNPDTVVEPDAFRRMVAFMEAHPRAGGLGCQLLGADSSRQYSARRFPTLTTYFLQSTGLAWRYQRNRFFGQFELTYWDGQSERQVDWVCGAVLMMRREVVNRIGGFDPYFFLTYDEVDLCHRIKNAGWEVWYTPDAKIMHLEGQSDPQSDISKDGLLKYMTVERNSRVHYFRKHHGLIYAILVELLHVALAILFLVKAKIFGTTQPEVHRVRQWLLLRLFRETLARAFKMCVTPKAKRAPDTGAGRLLWNPYLEKATRT